MAHFHTIDKASGKVLGTFQTEALATFAQTEALPTIVFTEICHEVRRNEDGSCVQDRLSPVTHGLDPQYSHNRPLTERELMVATHLGLVW